MPYVEETVGEYEGGWRKRRSKVDHIVNLRQILGKMLGREYVFYLLTFKQRMTLYGERKYGVKCVN